MNDGGRWGHSAHGDAIRLLRCAMEAEDWQLCRELLRFLRSIDDTGEALRSAVRETGLLDNGINGELSEMTAKMTI